MSRHSIEAATFGHSNPIPCASRIGPLLMSSIIGPMTPGSTHVPEDVSEQIENLFIHVEAILTAAGGTWADVIKMNFFVASLDLRAAINSPWVERFPDVGHRPARHSQLTSMAGVGKVQCDVTAYILAG